MNIGDLPVFRGTLALRKSNWPAFREKLSSFDGNRPSIMKSAGFGPWTGFSRLLLIVLGLAADQRRR